MNNRLSHIDVLRAHQSTHCFVFCLLFGVFAAFPPQTARGQTLMACTTLTPTSLSLSETNFSGEYEVLLRLTTLAAGQSVFVVPTIANPNPNVMLDISPDQIQFVAADIPSGGGLASKKFRVAVRSDADDVGGEVEIQHAVLGTNCEQEGGVVTVTVSDSGAPVPAVAVSKQNLILAEANAMDMNALNGEYTLNLASYPSGNVSIEVTSSDSLAAKSTLMTRKLTFTQANWFDPQTVVLIPVDDADGSNEDVTISHKATGGGYDNVSIANVTVRVVDPDPFVPVPGVTISAAAALDLHEGQMRTYTVVLDSDPGVQVRVLVQSGNPAAIRALPTSLTFSPGTVTTANRATHWATPHTVTVTAPDDPNAYSESGVIKHTGIGGPYEDIDIDSIMVQVWDDEARSVTLSNPVLIVNEGETATYTVVLGSRPLNTVAVTLASSVPDKASFTPESLEFTTLNWDAPQTITLKALRDADTDADTATITHEAANGGYDEVDAAELVVVMNDTGTVTSAEDAEDTLPTDFALEGNYPNPFNPFTEISYSLPQQAHVNLTVYDMAGREVHRLVNASQPAGRYQVRWNGTDAQGLPVRSGVYFYRLATESWSKTQSMVLLK